MTWILWAFNQFKNLLIDKLDLKEKNMDNTVIKVKNLEHGKHIIEFFRNKGINTFNYAGIETEEDDPNGLIYYGVINGEFGHWYYGYVRDRFHYVNIIELPEEKTFPRKMLVWDHPSELPKETIVLWKNPFGKPDFKYVVVSPTDIDEFLEDREYDVEFFMHAKEIDDSASKKQELLDKANELIQKAEELKLKAKEL